MRNSLANRHEGAKVLPSRTPSHNLVLRDDVLRTGVFVRPSDIKIDSVAAAAGGAGGRRRAQAGEAVVVIFHVEAP
eukprot:COSAG04_NODE_2847_length_3491_cov_3.264741_2_plen_76_part_00